MAIGENTFSKNDGYYENNKFIVTWAFGHLFGLIDIEEYAADYNPNQKYIWSLNNLPFFPYPFKFELKKDSKTRKIDKGIKKQFEIIKKLALRNDVDCLINAGDADREGEVIIRNIFNHIPHNKPVMRLWLPEQTANTIISELRSMKNDADYDDLFNEGLARTYMDWLYGVNLTRLASIKSRTLLRVGRVIIPIVKAIYDRDNEIKNFVPEKYYVMNSNEKTKGIPISLTSKKKFNKEQKDEVQQMCDVYNSQNAIVSNVKKERKTISPGKLFSLSKLQGVLGKKYKMSLKESLDIVQKLYEAGYVTYPRTNSEYLATAEADKINKVVGLLSNMGYKVEPKDGKKSIYDDSKIESHSALTPTYKFPKKENLSEKEWIVYVTILRRFVAVFCAVPCLVDRTTISIKVGNLEDFEVKGDVYVQKGWKQYEDVKTEDKLLPELNIGDHIAINFKPLQKETNPPKHYTVETLNNYLKNPFKKQKEEEDNELEQLDEVENSIEEDEDFKAIINGLELGTEATRTGIIENAKVSNYISLKNNSYFIEPKGIFLIETLEHLGIQMDKYKTAELGKALKQVYRREISINDSIKLAATEIKKNFHNCAEIKVEKTVDDVMEPIGQCPKCGGTVIEKQKGYFCTNKDCKFALWKEMKHYNNVFKITKAKAKALLTGNKQAKFKMKSKSGHEYEAYMKIKLNGDYVNFELASYANNNSKNSK